MSEMEPEREIWAAQSVWMGYASLAAAVAAALTAPLFALSGRSIPAAILILAAVAAASRAAWKRSGYRYSMTGSTLRRERSSFRKHDRETAYLPLAVIERLEIKRSAWQRALGVGDILLYAHSVSSPVMRLINISEPELAARRIQHQMRGAPGAAVPSAAVCPPFPVEELLAQDGRRVQRALSIAAAALILAAALAAALHTSSQRADEIKPVYAENDPIYYPDGTRKPFLTIKTYMQARVMPFAKEALGPVVGDENVRCETCHGENPEKRRYRMPAVSALPNSRRPGKSAQRSASSTDLQIHNAIVGHAHDFENAPIAEQMRRVVLPGMAELLNRPVYDRSKTYQYNKANAAFGCYHCHQLNKSQRVERQPDTPP